MNRSIAVSSSSVRAFVFFLFMSFYFGVFIGELRLVQFRRRFSKKRPILAALKGNIKGEECETNLKRENEECVATGKLPGDGRVNVWKRNGRLEANSRIYVLRRLSESGLLQRNEETRMKVARPKTKATGPPCSQLKRQRVKQNA